MTEEQDKELEPSEMSEEMQEYMLRLETLQKDITSITQNVNTSSETDWLEYSKYAMFLAFLSMISWFLGAIEGKEVGGIIGVCVFWFSLMVFYFLFSKPMNRYLDWPHSICTGFLIICGLVGVGISLSLFKGPEAVIIGYFGGAIFALILVILFRKNPSLAITAIGIFLIFGYVLLRTWNRI